MEWEFNGYLSAVGFVFIVKMVWGVVNTDVFVIFDENFTKVGRCIE